jgi:chemotaxis protein histidine kinase CheA
MLVLSEKNLGKIRPIYRGTYDPQFTYTPLDFLKYQDEFYVNIETSTGNLPTDSQFFDKIVSAGAYELAVRAGYTDTEEAFVTSLLNIVNIESFKDAAETAAQNAAESETNAATSESNAEGSATAAANSATASANSATQSANSATAAANSASVASTSESNASNSATASANSATASANSASAAATSESNASSSATASANSATASANSATSAANSLEEFQEIYHGARSTAPTVNVDVGDLYFDTVKNEMLVYNNDNFWVQAVRPFDTVEINQSGELVFTY